MFVYPPLIELIVRHEKPLSSWSELSFGVGEQHPNIDIPILIPVHRRSAFLLNRQQFPLGGTQNQIFTAAIGLRAVDPIMQSNQTGSDLGAVGRFYLIRCQFPHFLPPRVRARL